MKTRVFFQPLSYGPVRREGKNKNVTRFVDVAFPTHIITITDIRNKTKVAAAAVGRSFAKVRYQTTFPIRSNCIKLIFYVGLP